ncbi:MAG: hypothetical protein M3N15_08650 [Actinomycetota bacterium]|nr:hypothetical protein [Actinomycetota bacterium]
MHDTQPEPDGRREVHNAAFDEDVANAHLCGMTDLRTGRTCVEPVHHRGPCRFVVKNVAQVHEGVTCTHTLHHETPIDMR